MEKKKNVAKPIRTSVCIDESGQASRIWIVGVVNLQNRALAIRIAEVTTHITEVWPTLHDIGKLEGLLLVDCGDRAAHEALPNLFGSTINARYGVALFNVSANDVLVDHLLGHPKLVGLFLESISVDKLMVGIAGILEGQLWLPRIFTSALMARVRDFEHHQAQQPSLDCGLTHREAAVLALLCDGENNKSIAKHLNISLFTVKTHLYNIFRKLNVGSRLEAVTKARGWKVSEHSTIVRRD